MPMLQYYGPEMSPELYNLLKEGMITTAREMSKAPEMMNVVLLDINQHVICRFEGASYYDKTSPRRDV